MQLQPLQAMAQIPGDFWFLMDPFQGIQNPHVLERDFRNKIQWRGIQLDRKLLERGEKMERVVRLTQAFRMPELHINHIKQKNIVPVRNYPEATGVEGLGVQREVCSRIMPG